MSALSIRRLDSAIVERLRERAARHGVPMEEEVRQILTAAVSSPERLGEFAVSCFDGAHADLELPKRQVSEPIDMS